jgi:hypothetical protein
MGKYGAGLALAILVACTGLPRASHAQAMGEVRVAFAKAGLIAGAGAGRGVPPTAAATTRFGFAA